jgi:hypothetical protein
MAVLKCALSPLLACIACLACIVHVAAGCVREADVVEDTLVFDLDGEHQEIITIDDIAAVKESGNIEELEGAFAVNDTLGDKKYMEPMDFVMHASHFSEWSLLFSLPEELGNGTHALNRSLLPRAAEPYLSLVVLNADGSKRRFLPVDGSSIDVEVKDGRLLLSWDRIELVDECGAPAVMENGTANLQLLSSLAQESFPTYPDENTALQVEGSIVYENNRGPFADLAPFVAPPDASDPEWFLSAINLCTTQPDRVDAVNLSFPVGTSPGEKSLADLFGFATVLDDAGETILMPFSGGTINITRFDEDGGFLELDVTAPLQTSGAFRIVDDELVEVSGVAPVVISSGHARAHFE